MIKLQTGKSTNMDFIKAMKERGQNVKAELPAETLRDQLNALEEDITVTFNSTNETVLEAVNSWTEPSVDQATLTIDLNGGTIGEDPTFVQVLEKGSSFSLTNFYENYVVGMTFPEGKTYVGITTVKDDASTKIEDESITVNEDTTLYILYANIVTLTIDMNGGLFNGEPDANEMSVQEGYVLIPGEYYEMVSSLITPPEGKSFSCMTTTKDDLGTEIETLTVNEDTTVYMYWKETPEEPVEE